MTLFDSSTGRQFRGDCNSALVKPSWLVGVEEQSAEAKTLNFCAEALFSLQVHDGQMGMFEEHRVVGTTEISKTRSRKLKHVVQLGHGLTIAGWRPPGKRMAPPRCRWRAPHLARWRTATTSGVMMFCPTLCSKTMISNLTKLRPLDAARSANRRRRVASTHLRSMQSTRSCSFSEWHFDDFRADEEVQQHAVRFSSVDDKGGLPVGPSAVADPA